MNHLVKQYKKQKGFTLIEIMIAMGIIGAAVAVVLYYQSKAESASKVTDTTTAVTTMISKIKTIYGSSGYTTLSATAVNGMSIITQPLKWDGTSAVLDSWGNAMSLNGSASSFALTLGGATSAITKDECVTLATNLANSAKLVSVGAVTAASGAISGGKAYKDATGALSIANLADPAGCGATSPVVGLQF